MLPIDILVCINMLHALCPKNQYSVFDIVRLFKIMMLMYGSQYRRPATGTPVTEGLFINLYFVKMSYFFSLCLLIHNGFDMAGPQMSSCGNVCFSVPLKPVVLLTRTQNPEVFNQSKC